MPDPNKQALSATQIPALFGLSPYTTEWLLYQQVVNGLDDQTEPNERMDWGTLLQPIILAQAAERLGLEVTETDQFVRHPEYRIGATEDARVVDPSLGLGVVEAKNVDWLVFRDEWNDKKQLAPKHIEIQVQVQMLVLGATWGVIAALVGGNELVLWRRQPNPEIQQEIIAAVDAFWQRVDARDEPSPSGTDREIKALAQLYPEVKPATVKNGDQEIADLLLDWEQAKAERKAQDDLVKRCQAKILAYAGDNEMISAPNIECYISKTTVPATKSRKEYVRTTIKTREL